MGIPARLTGNHAPLHGTVSGDHILDHAGQNMSDMGLAVSRGRTVIKGIRLSLLAGIHALLKNVIVLPELTDFLLSVYKIKACVNFLIHDVLLSLKIGRPRPVKGRGQSSRNTTCYDALPSTVSPAFIRFAVSVSLQPVRSVLLLSGHTVPGNGGMPSEPTAFTSAGKRACPCIAGTRFTGRKVRSETRK